MDFEAEASKFDELVQKVGSIFCQFPYGKECRLAILGLSDLEDLNEAMEGLTENFGSDACDFALRVVQAKWRPNTLHKKLVTINRNEKEENTLDLLALLYYNAKSFCGEFRVDDYSFPLSPIVKMAIKYILQKNVQLKRDPKYRGGFVSCLYLSHHQAKEVLDDIAFSGLFTQLCLGSFFFAHFGHNTTDNQGNEVPRDDVDRVLRILQKGLVEDLRCISNGIPTSFTLGLIDVLKRGRIKILSLQHVIWSYENESIQHLCTGLEAFKESLGTTEDTIRGSGLLQFTLRVEYGSPRWGKENISRLIKALGGLPTLQRCHLYLNGRMTISVLQSLTHDLLLHPQCNLVELHLGGEGIETDDSAEPDINLKELCNSIARCSSMRALTISCTPFTLTRLSILFDHMTSPDCRIEQFHFSGPRNEYASDGIAVIAKSFENLNPHHSKPSRLRRISSHCRGRRGFGLINHRSFRQDLQTNLCLLRDKLPYLESCSPYSDSDRRGFRLPYEDDTPDFIIANADIIAEIGLWQERNQCGRAFLLKTVAPTVPIGLWPTILEAATKKTSILTGEGPPVEGINYLVHGLVAANLIGGDLLAIAEESSHPPLRNEGDESSRRPKRQRMN